MNILLTAQNRRRLYWTNIKGVEQPEDKGILLKDIIQDGIIDKQKSYCLDTNYFKSIPSIEEYQKKCRRQIIFSNMPIQILKEGRTEEGKRSRQQIRKSTGRDSTLRSKYHKCYFGREGNKSNCLVTGAGPEIMILINNQFRKLTPVEAERLQGFGDGYTEGVSNTQRYKVLGNSFTVPVISHILKNMVYQ